MPPGVSGAGFGPQHVLSSGNSNAARQIAQRQIVELSRAHPRYGYLSITALLRRSGVCCKAKRAARIRREEGLQMRTRQRRMKRLRISTAQRQRATGVNDVWSWDFVEDQTENGSRLRAL